MPKSQVAHVANYDFGAPVAEAMVLKFRAPAQMGGKRTLRFEPAGVQDITVTVQVSEDGTTWADTTAANNITAVADAVIQANTWKEYVINLRAGKDLYMQVLALGGDRCLMQMRGPNLEIITI